MNCEICTLLLDDILLEDIAKARIMKKHLDVLHRKMPLDTKNCQPCKELLLMIDGQIAEVRLDEISVRLQNKIDEVAPISFISEK